MDHALGARLAALRAARGWPLDRLAAESGVSRASLARYENAETSPTAEALGRIAAALGVSLSRLFAEIEPAFDAHLPRAAQPVWRDAATGFARRAVSPPAHGLAGELLEGALPAGAEIAYPQPPSPGRAHHLLLLEGALTARLDGADRRLEPGDCLRYRLSGPSAFRADGPGPARYLLFMA